MNQIKLAKQFYIDEMNDFFTYTEIAKSVKDTQLKNVLLKIAKMEEEHASFWKEFLEKRGETVPEVSVNKLKIRFLQIIAKFINPVLVISFLEIGEASAFQKYYKFLKEADLSEEEKQFLKKIILDEIEHETIFAKKTENTGISNIRDFVLGMNDGLVEILGVVTGLSAVYMNNPFVVAISGLIVGVAGALSMGIGAFISVRSQRQVNEAIREKLQIIFDIAQERAIEEFKEKLLETGIPEDLAEEISKKLGTNKEAIKKLLIKETNENEIVSGLFTGFAYIFGVFFPVLPYFIAPSSLIALPFSILFAGLALAIVATIIATLSGISIKKKIMEMVFSAFFAAGVSYLFGSLMQNLFGINI